MKNEIGRHRAYETTFWERHRALFWCYSHGWKICVEIPISAIALGHIYTVLIHPKIDTNTSTVHAATVMNYFMT